MAITRTHLLAAALLVAILPACTRHTSRQTNFMESSGEIDMSKRELQIRINEFAVHFAGEVELAADAITDGSSDPEARRQAILWKIHAVPEMHRAVFQNDPLAAAFDAWVFCIQMREYFETGAGSEAFGELQPIAIETSRRLETRMETLVKFIKTDDDDISAPKGRVTEFARAHPITNPVFVRDSAQATLSILTAQEQGTGLAAVGDINEIVQDLVDRITIWSEYAPRQARWQSELIFEDMPLFIARERDAAMVAFSAQGEDIAQSALEVADERMLMAFDEIAREREAIFGALQNEREIILAALRNERAIVLEAVREERIAAFAELDAIAQRSMGTAFTEGSANAAHLVNSLFWRIVLVIAVILIAFAAGARVALKIARAELAQLRPRTPA
jgi:hypothetical protein